MSIEDLRLNCSIKQKKGLHFIMASVLIWSVLTWIHMTEWPIEMKNLATFIATAPLMPIAFVISKIIKVDFTNKNNPLTNLGILFSINQMLYLFIAMWIFVAKPESLVMILAMIFGAHLLPYGWLYQSKTYYIMSVLITLAALIVGVNYEPYILAIIMIAVEIIFSFMLYIEVRKLL